MTIKEILELPAHRDVVGIFTIVTTHKMRKDPLGDYVHRNSISDKTGEMEADFAVRVNKKMVRNETIEIIQARTQPKDEGCRLYVEAWKQVGEPISEPPTEYHGEAHIVRSKIKCHLASAQLVNTPSKNVLSFLKSKECDDIIEEILS